MKKIINALLVSLLLICLIACSSNNANMPNPVKSYSSLQEINQEANVDFADFDVDDIKTDERFNVIDGKIAEYSFKLDDKEYTLRGSCVMDEDISGVYIDGKPAFEDLSLKEDYATNDEYLCAMITINNKRYTVVTKGNDDDIQDFANVLANMSIAIAKNTSDPKAIELIGQYMDSVSQRAVMYVDIYNTNDLVVEIMWASSADTYDDWLFEGIYEDGKISFDECAHYSIVDDGGDYPQYNLVDETSSGYIEVIDGKVIFSNSNINDLMNCVFEKIPE